MIALPSFATHYFLEDRGPFRSLSDLPQGADDPVFADLLTRHRRDPTYRRRFGREYIALRKSVEDRLRSLFMARGGKPKRAYPFYFVLGESPWFRDLNGGHREFRIDLARLNPETTSITYPDSFVALTEASKPYFNKVFLLPELAGAIETFGLPRNDRLIPYERYWESDFELYFEIQVWENPSELGLNGGPESSNLPLPTATHQSAMGSVSDD